MTGQAVGRRHGHGGPVTDLELLPPVQPEADRQQRRRRAMLTEILTVSLEVMREEGVAGLSLAEVARRIGVKPPSLYKHVDSKLAVYDLLFAAGARAHWATVEAAVEGLEPGLATLRVGFEASVRWCVEHPTLTQLMYWRPVPGYEPSPEAFAPSLEVDERSRQVLVDAVDSGELRPEAASPAGLALFTCLISGLITQQLANEPGAPFDEGRFTRHTREAFALFVDHYGMAPHRHDRAQPEETP
jgi:AcrR family transcriptional regulator